ncbi:hypothetical protein Tco_1267377 [Tanacetum coccineum]
MASKQSSSGPALHKITPGTISSRLMPQPPSPTLFVPPTRNDWDTLFQPLFDEYFRPLPQSPSQVIPPGVGEADHDIKVEHMDNNPYFGLLIREPSFEESCSQVVILNNVHSVNQLPEHISKWTKDHPINNVIGDPSRPVSTSHQLQTEALFCYFNAFLSSVEPKRYKVTLTESYWIKAMQEELNEFEHL